MIDAAIAAFRQVLTPPFRAVLYKSVGAAIALMVVAGFGLEKLIQSQVFVSTPWLDAAIKIASAFGIVVGAVFLVPITSTLIASIFLDEIAEQVERTHYPADPVGTPVPPVRAGWLAVKFFLVVAGVNLLALILLLIPGVNVLAFFLANAYLLSREYFELAAMRFRPEADAKALRRAHAGKVMIAGLPMAALLMVPILNLLTPLFGTAMMVHLHKKISGSTPSELLPPPKIG